FHSRMAAGGVRADPRVRGDRQRPVEPSALDDHRPLSRSAGRVEMTTMKLMKRAQRIARAAAQRVSRRDWLIRAGAAVGAILGGTALTGCERLSRTQWFPGVLAAGEKISEAVHKAIGRNAMAQEFSA